MNPLFAVCVKRSVIHIPAVEYIGDAFLIDKGIHLCPVVFLGRGYRGTLRQNTVFTNKSQAQMELDAGLGFAKMGPLVPLQTKRNGCRVDDFDRVSFSRRSAP